MKKAYELLSIRQVDKKLKQLKQLKELQPKEGWIVYIRSSIALSTAGLARLMGIKQPSALAMEKREQNKTITLETLENAANAMGCELVYGFVPRGSLENFVEQKKVALVEKIIQKTHLTMSLENQGLNQQNLNEQKILLLEDLKSKPMNFLWRNL